MKETIEITSKSAAQVAIFSIDHRLLECRFYRVSSSSGHRSVIQVLRDAGHNPESDKPDFHTSDNAYVGRSLRKAFNSKGWSYIEDSLIPRLAVKEVK